MAQENAKPLVLVVGTSGNTGRSIVDGLLKSGNFRSSTHPHRARRRHKLYARRGVEVRIGDIHDDVKQLEAVLRDVDVLISAVPGWLIREQKDIFRAAKEAGVKRVVPSDFGTPGAKGIRALHDTKLEIREFIQALGVGYTFVDVGGWMQGWLPLPSRSSMSDEAKQVGYTYLDDGSVQTLVTDRRHIGTHVARIIADPRTLHHAVIVWEDAPSQAEAQALAVRLSGDGEALREKFVRATRDTFRQAIEEGKREIAADPSALGPQVTVKVSWNGYLYMHSILVLQENTLANAKRLGYLDMRELYPEMPRYPLKEFAEEFYNLPEPGEEYNAYARKD
ncbi:NAD-P-binding protein [Lentinus tigrinus ALCF2SS1-7]|uniref:NAD-P-binding protein n=1 Tax=Lentinus tigrinus ALCF2SS1-6 TaxID=1328759 RepID=A0A5C2S3L4_9APHY|nr:NAD-P-binding protein [Lentinus tigrinus ALCF2SS1-6]RPD72227.1 NAD-P-binding protein [Lentinus tigrinus ALCF2SS1-7]